MTGKEMGFSEAVDRALSRSDSYEQSLEVVNELTKEFHTAVTARMDELVSVELVPEIPLPLSKLERLVGRVFSSREVGDDPEDKQNRFFIIAKAKSGHGRILWGVELENSGLPVRLAGPAEDESIACLTLDELRREFVNAASHGTVGRKLTALHKLAATHPDGDARDYVDIDMNRVKALLGQMSTELLRNLVRSTYEIRPQNLSGSREAFIKKLLDWISDDPENHLNELSESAESMALRS